MGFTRYEAEARMNSEHERRRRAGNDQEGDQALPAEDACASSAKIGAKATKRYGTTSRSHATRPISFVYEIANESAPSVKKATETARRGRDTRADARATRRSRLRSRNAYGPARELRGFQHGADLQSCPPGVL
jgi:hypothetical protein